MLTPETIAAAARASFEMHRARTRYRPLDATLRAAPLDDAYRVQDALHQIMAESGRGERYERRHTVLIGKRVFHILLTAPEGGSLRQGLWAYERVLSTIREEG